MRLLTSNIGLSVVVAAALGAGIGTAHSQTPPKTDAAK